MNTNKSLTLCETQVDRVTQMFRAFKHPYRYDMVNMLISQGSLTAPELASFVGLEEKYVRTQLDILLKNKLVLTSLSKKQIRYSANEEILMKMKRGLANLV